MFCQVQVSATGRSLIQRSPTDCDVSEYDLETSTMRRPRPTTAIEIWGKKCINVLIQMKTSPENNIVNGGHRHQSWNLHQVRLVPYNYSHSKCVSKHTLYYGIGLVLFRKSGVVNKMLVAEKQIIGHKEHSQKRLTSPGNKHDGKWFEVKKK
jgi:hypothetical protein